MENNKDKYFICEAGDFDKETYVITCDPPKKNDTPIKESEK